MKRFFTILFAAMLTILAVGCDNAYDDSGLVGRLDDLENRVTTLEEQCQTMNSNIAGLQTIVNALQQNDYITSVTPVVEGGETIGYTITFLKADPITIYNGTDGKDGVNGEDGKDGGYVPEIGVKQDADGNYYWTLDGEWVLDEAGNKIPTTGDNGKDGEDGKDGENGENGEDGTPGTPGNDGKDGEDGVTPQLKIENDYWYVSYDNGATWNQLGKATGEDGKDGENGKDGEDGAPGKDGEGSCIFKGVTEDDYNVYFTLADGTTITIPKFSPLSITFEQECVATPNESLSVAYTVESPAESVEVEVVTSGDLKAKAVAADESGKSGSIEIIFGEVIDEYSKVIVFVSDGERVIMKSLSFEEAGLEIYGAAEYIVGSEGGSVTLEFMTNVAVEVEIPAEAEWLSVAPATRALQYTTVTLDVAANSGEARSAQVAVKSAEGLSLTFTVNQEAGTVAEPAKVTIAEFLAAEVNADVWYELTGTITSIANTTYGNFDLTDESATVYVYGLTATQVSSNDKSFASLGLKVGDTLTLIGTRAEYKEVAQVGGPAYYVSHVEGEEPELGENVAVLSFDSTDYRTVFTAEQQVWEQNGISFTNDKASSTNDIADYAGPVRLYKGSSITVEASGLGMSAINFICNNATYATALKDSIVEDAAYTATINNASEVLVSFTQPVTSFIIEALGAQIRLNSIQVTVAEEQGGEEPELTPSAWSMVGGFNNWTVDAGTTMYAVDGYYVAYGFEYAAGVEFKFVENAGWAVNRGGNGAAAALNTAYDAYQNGSNITIAAAGTYDIYLNEALDKYYVMEAGKTPTDAEQQPDTTETWGLMGDFENNNWVADIALVAEGKYYVAQDVVFANANGEGLAFKVRKNANWDISYGADGSTYELGTEIALNGSYNIFVNGVVGEKYDIYFSAEELKIWVMQDGKTPVESEQPDTPDTWDVMGDFADNNWTTPIELVADGSYYVAQDVVFANANNEGLAFKVRKNANWNTCYGADGSTYELGTEIALNGSANVFVNGVVGEKYDFYFDATNMTIWVMQDGLTPGQTPEVEEPAVVKTTVVEFLAAAEDDTIYELTGTIGGTIKAYYGNFDLTDATGTVYIYGLVDASGTFIWDSLGLKAGDTITVQGKRTSYNGSPQMKNGLYISHVAGDDSGNEGGNDEPEIIETTVVEFLAAEESTTQWYKLTGTITNIANTTYGNFDLTDETGTVYVYGLTATQVSSNDKSFASLGLTEGDIVTLIGTRSSYYDDPQVGGPAYYVSHVEGELPEPEGNVATISFESVDNRTVFTTEQQVWEQNGITVTNNKSASTSNVADYSGPARFYKSSDVIVEAASFEKVVFHCSGSQYALNLSDSSNYTVSGSGTTEVTITMTAPATTLEITGLANQIRVSSIDVYFAE